MVLGTTVIGISDETTWEQRPYVAAVGVLNRGQPYLRGCLRVEMG